MALAWSLISLIDVIVDKNPAKKNIKNGKIAEFPVWKSIRYPSPGEGEIALSSSLKLTGK